MPQSDGTDPLNDIDQLVHEDMVLCGKIRRLEQARDARHRYHAQQAREQVKPFEDELAPLQEGREGVRAAILSIWKKHFEDDTTLDLPSAKVSRRNYREMVIHDRAALHDALDRADRLDLTEHAFDEQAVVKLIAAGELKDLPAGAVEIIDRYNLQVRSKGS